MPSQSEADNQPSLRRLGTVFPMTATKPDVAVATQDPAFGGGGSVQTAAFAAAVGRLGREPRLVFNEHPALHGKRLTWRRVEALRQLAAERTLVPCLERAGDVWVVATMAHTGAAAARCGLPYGCWIGTTIGEEWRGRRRLLGGLRRAAAAASVPVLRRLERTTLQGAARVYATSPATRSAVAEAGGLEIGRIGLLRIPVDLDRFRPAPDDQWHDALQRRTLVFVGRGDDPRKNAPALLELARLLPDATIRLVGRQPRLPLPSNVVATGEVRDVAAELRRAAVFVLPSWQEGFGIAAAEAMAAGLPVVTSPCGGPEELVRASGGGRIAASFDAVDIASAVEDVLGHAQELRRHGRAYVEREHSMAVFTDAVARALAEVELA